MDENPNTPAADAELTDEDLQEVTGAGISTQGSAPTALGPQASGTNNYIPL
jgi:hypothetical protein